MKLTQERVSRYLKKQKIVNNFLIKIINKNNSRYELGLLTKAISFGFEIENILRELNESFINEKN